VIGPAEHLPALQARGGMDQTSAFEDTDALGALDAITDERPDVVLIERGFADTPRGAALIKRIKADPTLTVCDIRVVAHDGRDLGMAASSPAGLERTASGTPGTTAAVATAPITAPISAPTTASTPAAKLDRRGTRRSPRMVMPEGLEVQIDGHAATLIDLSQIGAQVVSPTSLRPKQRVRVTLPDPTQPTRCRAAVAWVALEIPRGLARYRAGIEFLDADQALVARFIQAHKDKK
jgi:hypothetical protein